MNVCEKLKNIENITILEQADMKKLTTFRAGGIADAVIYPETAAALAETVRALQGEEYMPLGGGSNLLVLDGGYHGTMISTVKLNDIRLTDEHTVYAEAGARLSSVCAFALNNGLVGMEFAGGIPGTVGGGVFMNAGAYGGELKDIIVYADVMDKDGNIIRMQNDELGLDYRHSALMDMDVIIVGAAFHLEKGDVTKGREYLAELNKRRRDKQPTDLPSAGSTFKRPAGYFAGALIEQSGLKGCTIGGAQVSEKHCGFVVNIGGATATDIHRLIQHVQQTVREKLGVELEMEVRIIGEEA